MRREHPFGFDCTGGMLTYLEAGKLLECCLGKDWQLVAEPLHLDLEPLNTLWPHLSCHDGDH